MVHTLVHGLLSHLRHLRHSLIHIHLRLHLLRRSLIICLRLKINKLNAVYMNLHTFNSLTILISIIIGLQRTNNGYSTTLHSILSQIFCLLAKCGALEIDSLIFSINFHVIGHRKIQNSSIIRRSFQFKILRKSYCR